MQDRGVEAFVELSKKLPLLEDWKPVQNVELLIDLTRKSELSEEWKKWFIKQITIGSLPEGVTLGDLGVRQADIGDPVAPVRERMKDPAEGLAYLSTLLKMGVLGALARVPLGQRTIDGHEIVTIPNFIVYNKDKPRDVANYAKRVKISRRAFETQLEDWAKNPIHMDEWIRNDGMLSFNSLINKNDKTLSYLSISDVAAYALALGPNAYHSAEDLSGSYYQMMQHRLKLAYQNKVVPLPNGGVVNVHLMGRQMGDSHACAVGNHDTGTKMRLAETHAKLTNSKARYQYSRDEVRPPTDYGLKSKLRPYDLKRFNDELLRKEQNLLKDMHYKGRRVREYRFLKHVRCHVHYQDDMLTGRTENMEATWLGRHVRYFFGEKIYNVLSTEQHDPAKIAIFCGIMINGVHFGFAEIKWTNYTQVVYDVTSRPYSTAGEIMRMNGILANTAILFPKLKIALALVAHHFAEIIRIIAGARTNARLKQAWKRLLKQQFVMHDELKKVVRESWDKIKGRTVHARQFVVMSGDARDENVLSTDVAPDGLGIVDHSTGESWAAILDRKKCKLINRWPYGKISSTGFENCGVLVMTHVVAKINRIHVAEYPVIYRVYQDNTGAEAVCNPNNPLFKKDYLASAILIRERCEKLNIVLVPDRLDTKTIPADAPSRMNQGIQQCMKELKRRWILAFLTSRWRSFGNKADLNLLGLKGNNELLDMIAAFLPDVRFSKNVVSGTE